MHIHIEQGENSLKLNLTHWIKLASTSPVHSTSWKSQTENP